MPRHHFGYVPVSRGGQHDLSAPRVFLFQQPQQFIAVGQMFRCKSPAQRKFLLEPRASGGEPERQPEQIAPIRQNRCEGRFVQGIDPQQRSVHVDT